MTHENEEPRQKIKDLNEKNQAILEEMIEEFKSENERLKSENEWLKSEVNRLNSENQRLREENC